MSLKDKRILLGITGSIAAYRICDLVGLFRKEGAQVRCIVTPSAEKLVSLAALEALTGNPVLSDCFGGTPGTIPHIEWIRWAHLYIIAPCTAQSLADLAQGSGNTLVSLCALSSQIPVAVAPTMNSAMLHAPATQKNIKQLKEYGYWVLPPGQGDLACGESGEGKILDTPALLDYAKIILELSYLNIYKSYSYGLNKKAIVTLGHTREPIDAVRSLVNTSSGLTGLLIARALRLFDIQIFLLHGYTDIPLGNEWGDKALFCPTTEAFADKAQNLLDSIDILIASAALADFIPQKPESLKIKNSKLLSNIDLKPSNNILEQYLSSINPQCYSLGFALENPGFENEALNKWSKRPTTALLVNTPHSSETYGFGKSLVPSILLHKNSPHQNLPSPLDLNSKVSLAVQVTQQVRDHLRSTPQNFKENQ